MTEGGVFAQLLGNIDVVGQMSERRTGERTDHQQIPRGCIRFSNPGIEMLRGAGQCTGDGSGSLYGACPLEDEDSLVTLRKKRDRTD